MATFKVTKTTIVAELKNEFQQQVGGFLRVYNGRSEAADDATLVSLGAKEGVLECRTSRTVGKFEEAFQTELNLKVKVYTKDNWVKVLDGITLATVKDLPNGMTKAKMEEYLAYKRDEETEEPSKEVVDGEDEEEDEDEVYLPESTIRLHTNCEGWFPYDYGTRRAIFILDKSYPYNDEPFLPFDSIETVLFCNAEHAVEELSSRDEWSDIQSDLNEKNIVTYYASADDIDSEDFDIADILSVFEYIWGDSDDHYHLFERLCGFGCKLNIYINDVLVGKWNSETKKLALVKDIAPIQKFLQRNNAVRLNLNDK